MAFVQALLMDRTLNFFFGGPVPDDVPGYREVVRQPMDLATIKGEGEGVVDGVVVGVVEAGACVVWV